MGRTDLISILAKAPLYPILIIRASLRAVFTTPKAR